MWDPLKQTSGPGNIMTKPMSGWSFYGLVFDYPTKKLSKKDSIICLCFLVYLAISI